MTQIINTPKLKTSYSPSLSLSLVSELTRRTATITDLDGIFSETIVCLKSILKTNHIQIFTYAIKNQKLDFEYQKVGATGPIRRVPIKDLPAYAELVRSATAEKATNVVEANPDNQLFISSATSPVVRIAIPFLYREKVLGCIHIECEQQIVLNNEILLCGELIGRHLGLICSNAIELHHLVEFKSRVRKLINAKVAQLEEALERADKYNQSLKDFSYIVSHDLREPLRTINSYIKLLERRYASNFDGDARDFMFFVTNGVARMDALIKDLLAFSRVQHSVYQFENSSLERILALVNNSLRLKVAETGAQIIFDNPPNINGSKSHLYILFQNLIDNALKFRKENVAPIIRIESKELNDHWQFDVIDNGIGMNLENKTNDRIFKIFQRLHGLDSPIPGTGIGLAICKNIVQAHKGQIWVSSSVGQGATFHFTIAKVLCND